MVVTTGFLVEAPELRSFVSAILRTRGVPARDAETVADCLVCANLSGFDSHGVVRLGHYVRRLENGTIKARPRMRFEQVAAAAGTLDGDHGLGHVVTAAAAREATRMAREAGCATVSIRNSSHFGMTGYYVLGLVRQGLAAMLCTATDAFLVPHGGSRPFFGTNPLAIGFPTGDIPLLLDMATTTVSWGKLILAQKEGRKVPSEWGLDEQGRPCDDPSRIRGLHPIAGPKGSGLAMVIDILSNLLAGMAFGPHVTGMYGELDRPRGLGHFLVAWDIARFIPLARFIEGVDRMIRELHDLPPAPGSVAVRYPGAIEGLRRRERERDGIPLEAGVFRELEELGQRHGVAVTARRAGAAGEPETPA